MYEEKLFTIDNKKDLVLKKKLIKILPKISTVLSQEKLKDNEEAGIKKITKKTKLPIKPRALDKLIKTIFPRYPPLLLTK
jgi:Trp operon repressor